MRALGDIGRDDLPLESFFIRFLLDSLPLASESPGEPGRLSEAARGSPCFSVLPDGVFVAPVEATEGALFPASALSFSSSFFRSSSF